LLETQTHTGQIGLILGAFSCGASVFVASIPFSQEGVPGFRPHCGLLCTPFRLLWRQSVDFLCMFPRSFCSVLLLDLKQLFVWSSFVRQQETK
jgi:hypothetical protein